MAEGVALQVNARKRNNTLKIKGKGANLQIRRTTIKLSAKFQGKTKNPVGYLDPCVSSMETVHSFLVQM